MDLHRDDSSTARRSAAAKKAALDKARDLIPVPTLKRQRRVAGYLISSPEERPLPRRHEGRLRRVAEAMKPGESVSGLPSPTCLCRHLRRLGLATQRQFDPETKTWTIWAVERSQP